ncbi:WD40-repeat-containing domain protein [Lentinula boryana]|uniref:WD40-repeat-containing domain protein n=1 Tax=Lentinula boryana TaxID=40481 RepID=A0ABQ8Q0A0_9AGAR|nr:WD40-repeat-containing domain protein [Lentinula boryana]
MSESSNNSHRGILHSQGFASGTLFIDPSPPGIIDNDDLHLRTAPAFQSSRLVLKPSQSAPRFRQNPDRLTPGPDSDPTIDSFDFMASSGQSPIHRYRLDVESRCSTRIYGGTQSDKARRLLVSEASSSAYLVSMHGAMHEIDIISQHPSVKRSHDSACDVLLDDACLISSEVQTSAVLGHVRDSHQLSLVNLNEHNPHPYAIDLRRPWNESKRGGVSSVCAMGQPHSFATGGYDRVVHLWKLDSNHSSALAQPLAINHTNVVQSLLPVCDTSHKLISAGADCKVNIYNLSSQRVFNSFKTSNQINHLHWTHSPFCTLLEIANLELQFELRDHRIVPECPVLRFGYTTNQVRGRYTKGASLRSSSLFTCGDRYGKVRLWDLRNPKTVASEILCFAEPQRIVQVLFHQSRLLACTENGEVGCINYLSS